MNIHQKAWSALLEETKAKRVWKTWELLAVMNICLTNAITEAIKELPDQPVGLVSQS